MGVEDYCRELEAHLCRRNQGHLIRIVGPAFERVCGWAEQGIPLKVACRGIDRYCERAESKAGRRRPVRIEFCESDVLDVFDEWRRAIGVGAASATPDRRAPSLPSHLERVIARLTSLRSGADAAFDATLDAVIRELDVARHSARSLRGAARDALLQRLRTLDADLLAAFRHRLEDAELLGLAQEADAELAAFRERMPAGVYGEAHAACVDRLIREKSRLPTLALD